MFVDTDERLDTVVGTTDLKLIQKIDGTAFAVDTVLLADFIPLPSLHGRIADLGSGSGILAFLLKYRNPEVEVVGVEILEEFYHLAMRNLVLNPKMRGVTFERVDVREVPARFLPETFDMVVANPPYYQLGTGRIPERQARAIARHEISGTLKDFIEAASYLVSYGAKFFLIIPSGRFYEAQEALKTANFGIRRLRFIKPKEGQPAHLALVESEKFYNGPHEPVPELTIHLADGKVSPEVDEIFKTGLKRKPFREKK